MAQISLIAAIDEAGGIGINNQLLAYIPADLKYFKSVTMGKPIIMGRRTYESIGRALPGRTNLIVSSQLNTNSEITVVRNLAEAFELTKNTEEVMVIGGAKIFEEAMLSATRLYITKIHHQFNADVYFPQIDLTLWKCKEITKQPQDNQNPYAITFYIYERI